jgi:hypothetical protein
MNLRATSYIEIANELRNISYEDPLSLDDALSVQFTDKIAELLDGVRSLSQADRDRIALVLDRRLVDVFDAFVFHAVLRASKDKFPRWSERALLALTLFLSAPETLWRELDAEAQRLARDQTPVSSTSRALWVFVESNINKPLWSAEELGQDLPAFCERVALEASSAGASYLMNLARRPDLPYIARELSLRFADVNFAPIEVFGRRIYPFYRHRVQTGVSFWVRLARRSLGPDQAVVLDVRHEMDSAIRIDEDRAPSVLLWYDRWTEAGRSEVQATIVSNSPFVELHISNAWKLPDGTTGEWLGNYGVWTEREGNVLVLHFSDGLGPPSFDDLVVEIESSSSPY